MAIVQGILCIVSVIAVMQLLFFTATMEAYLGGDQCFGLSAALASMVCLGLNLGLLHYLAAPLTGVDGNGNQHLRCFTGVARSLARWPSHALHMEAAGARAEL